MSNKKHTPKPAEKKPGADESVPAAEEHVIGEDPAASDSETSEDQATETSAAEGAEDTALTQDGEVHSTETPAMINTAADTAASQPGLFGVELPAAATVGLLATDLATRLTRAVTAIQTSGKPELVQALHKVEMIVGDLKNSLPAAIRAAEGDPLEADLLGLLAVL